MELDEAPTTVAFLGRDSQPNQSPTLYATDQDSYVVQGWIVTDPEILAGLDIGDDETVVEVPPKLMTHLAKDGLNGDVTRLVPPIVHVTSVGNYTVQGKRVSDSEALGQMDIPDHETRVRVPKSLPLHQGQPDRERCTGAIGSQHRGVVPGRPR